MTCNRWNDDWVARLYGELEADSLRECEEHLVACEACRRTMDELGASRRLLQECDAAIPAAPRLVVLEPRGAWHGTWSFAAGAACALIAFAIGLYVAPTVAPDTGSRQAQQVDPASDSGTALASISTELTRLRETQHAFEARMASLEEQPTSTLQQLQQLEVRFDSERKQDLEAFMLSLTAAERRNGTFMDATREAIQVLALRQDPRFVER